MPVGNFISGQFVSLFHYSIFRIPGLRYEGKCKCGRQLAAYATLGAQISDDSDNSTACMVNLGSSHTISCVNLGEVSRQV